jgi:hypothetical protein
VEWTDYPIGWGGVEPDLPPPYVVREVLGWALNGADVSGCNIPGVRVLVPTEAARRSGMMPPTDSEMISPTVPR